MMNTRATVQHDVRHIYISNQHIVTFGETSTDLWRLSPDGASLNHHAKLSDFIPHPLEGIIVDEEKDLIVIPYSNSYPPALWVYEITSGILLRKVALFGSLTGWPLQYRGGRALVTVKENEEEAPPDGLTTVLLCDVAGDDWLLGDVKLPPGLAVRDRAPSYCSLVPVLFNLSGNVITTSSAFYEEKMTLLLWQEATDDDIPPSRTVDISLSLADGDSILPTCSLPLDDTSFLLCAYEHVEDALEISHNTQSTIHAFHTASLDKRWSADPIAGKITKMHLVPSRNMALAIGRTDEREDAGDFDFATVAVVLDTKTGFTLRADKINHGKHGSSVVRCALAQTQTQTGATPAVVVVFRNGDISVTPLDAFLIGGFSRDNESQSVNVSRPSEILGEVISAVVGACSAVLVTNKSKMHLVSW